MIDEIMEAISLCANHREVVQEKLTNVAAAYRSQLESILRGEANGDMEMLVGSRININTNTPRGGGSHNYSRRPTDGGATAGFDDDSCTITTSRNRGVLRDDFGEGISPIGVTAAAAGDKYQQVSRSH